MKTLCSPEPGNLVIKDPPMPELRGGQAIIKMEMRGIYGSDVTTYKGMNLAMRYSINGLGHEGVDVIQEIGENDKGLKPGDRVALEPCAPCDKCHICAARRFSNCADPYMYGAHRNGMMSGYFLRPMQLLYKLPDELTLTHAALVEPLTISLHEAARTRVPKGEYCAAFGAGIVGPVAVFACIDYGATPILVDVLRKRLDHARELGVPCTFNSGGGNAGEYLRGATNGKLPKAMTNCAGAPVILENMHNYICHGGRITLVGWPHDPVRINTIRLVQKETGACPSRSSNRKSPEAISLVNEGRVSTDVIIIEMIELDQVGDTIRDMVQSLSDYLKVIMNI